MTRLKSPPLTAEELYEQLKNIVVDNPLCSYTYERCLSLVPLINEIRELKEEKNAILLAHTYVHPDIIYGVADAVGDSYYLSKIARDADAETIVFPSVRFMAETAKILSPEKQVLDPNPNGGCSLADSITKKEVERLRNLYPEHTFVCYINTTAEVKAVCDVCVTSSNAYRILERLPTDKIYFLPDQLFAANARRELPHKEILTHKGSCYVHEEFTAEMIDLVRYRHPGTTVLAHPECKPEVVEKADVIGSTSDLYHYIKKNQAQKNPFLLLTECGVASRLNIEAPAARLVGGCHLCKYMRSNSLPHILSALKNPEKKQIIEIEPAILDGARRCIERMFEYAE